MSVPAGCTAGYCHGADRFKIDQVQKAHDYIAQAIAIKPDAHEGREKYQLIVSGLDGREKL